MDSSPTPLPSMSSLSTNFLPRESFYKRLSFSNRFVIVLLFVILFFIVLVYIYLQYSSSFDPESGDIHGQAALRSPVVVTVVAETAGKCPICLEEVGEGEPVKKIAYCKHIFHAECIDKWLETKVTCPYADTTRRVQRWSW
ncbi:hypothetical protein PHAVU_011G129900 [Phaseolus vulgaris]|uniref:RING-type domain-containing protein n=1 Tax=Phaseolus vulgaris TaxID=3885 RepID=V7AHV7_PHAVU|nr:hypothetical protein PHAVU_011G129900g [Phaseolus vulgaris]ESW04845.1 hypothetical protein PHAVU_011G129900g [Phaseolus vulgaris]